MENSPFPLESPTIDFQKIHNRGHYGLDPYQEKIGAQHQKLLFAAYTLKNQTTKLKKTIAINGGRQGK